MPAVIQIGLTKFFFGSMANAAKVADLLSKADPVEEEPREDYRIPVVYRLTSNESIHYSHDIEIKATKQAKPKRAQLSLPAPSAKSQEAE